MIFFVIPSYNEEKNLDKLFRSISGKMAELSLDYRIIVVDDGSTDGTAEKVESYRHSMPVTLIRNPRNMNVGEVFRKGLGRALEEAGEGDVIVTKEGDNTGDINILGPMIESINKGYDVALASCYAKGGGIVGAPIDRILFSSVLNTILRIMFPIKGVRTYSSFYRAHSAASLRRAFAAYGGHLIEEVGFVSMAEMLIKFNKIGMRMADIPMVLRCDVRRGKSKMNKSSTILAYAGLMLKGLTGGFDRWRAGA